VAHQQLQKYECAANRAGARGGARGWPNGPEPSR
jgi:hypothetical protein